MKNKPSVIRFSENGSVELGYLAIAEVGKLLPFDVKRMFWAYHTPDGVTRGRHAHYETEMVLVALAGRIILTTEMPGESPESFILERPNEGVYIPPLCWHVMQYSHNAVQLVIASTSYDEDDYIREYKNFKNL